MMKAIASRFSHINMVKNLNTTRFELMRASTSFTGEQKETDPTPTGIPVMKAIEGWEGKLKDAGVGDTAFNLRCLVAHILNYNFNALPTYKDLQFNDKQLKDFERFCEARCARMPLQHIIGEWDFMDLTLKTSPNVFIPRPETEEFVSKVINQYRNVDKSIEMLEVGCGSGAISLAILSALPHIKSTGIDRSKDAVELSKDNAVLCDAQDRFKVFYHKMQKDNYLPEALKDAKYDLIVSNPPYVKTEEFPLLQPEVTVYENITALDGGPDGLRVARLVMDLACIHLKPGGKLWFELGNDHPPLVKTIINTRYENVLEFISGHKDQYDRERFAEIRKL